VPRRVALCADMEAGDQAEGVGVAGVGAVQGGGGVELVGDDAGEEDGVHHFVVGAD
jgi:hypothetical protein